MPRFDKDNYISVDERIQKFYEDHKDGAIITKLISDPNNLESVVFCAAVYLCPEDQDKGRMKATGYAQETRGTKFEDGANFGSWVENCETSAIGRAIENAGYKVVRGAPRASAQEMAKADRVQGRKSTATRVQEHMEETGQEHPVANPVGPAGMWGGPGQCPTCHAPEGKRHGKPCSDPK